MVSAGLGALLSLSQSQKACVVTSVGLNVVLLVFFTVLINRQLCYEYAEDGV